MIKRVIIIGSPAFIRLDKGQLLIERAGELTGQVPCEDIGVLLLEHAQTTITGRALSECIRCNVAVLLCDNKHLPVAVLQPFFGNTLHAKVLRQQIGISESTKRRIWKQVIQRKIKAQLCVIEAETPGRERLKSMAQEVKSGDKTNVEAQAARLYWRLLFGGSFRRSTDGDGINALLNYGYAIVRAMTARAITMSGLHPALGIHHSNQYNAFALADDLFEPLRPFVDQRVLELIESDISSTPPKLCSDTKQRLLELSAIECFIGKQKLPLMVALQSYVASFKKVITGEDKSLKVPYL